MRCIMLVKRLGPISIPSTLHGLRVLPTIMERKKAVVTCNEGDVGS